MAGHTLETVIAILERDNGLDNNRVAKILNDFVDLPESDKDSARVLFAAKAFTVVFGEKARVRESEEYERQRQVRGLSSLRLLSFLFPQEPSVLQASLCY